MIRNTVYNSKKKDDSWVDRGWTKNRNRQEPVEEHLSKYSDTHYFGVTTRVAWVLLWFWRTWKFWAYMSENELLSNLQMISTEQVFWWRKYMTSVKCNGLESIWKYVYVNILAKKSSKQQGKGSHHQWAHVSKSFSKGSLLKGSTSGNIT